MPGYYGEEDAWNQISISYVFLRITLHILNLAIQLSELLITLQCSIPIINLMSMNSSVLIFV